VPEVTLLEANLSYPEHPIKILDQKDRDTRWKTIKFFKIQRSNHTEVKQLGKVRTFSILTTWILIYHNEGTCDCSLSLLEPFSIPISGRDFFLGGEGCDTPSVTIAGTMLQ
jgi:hypothetical protein